MSCKSIIYFFAVLGRPPVRFRPVVFFPVRLTYAFPSLKMKFKEKLQRKEQTQLTVAVLAMVPSRFKAGLRPALGLFTFLGVFLALAAA
jgi:hypothetical protein